MNAQTFLALAIVVITLTVFVGRWWINRNKTSCGGGCGCARKPAIKP